MNETYALASGYAELYERFCNKIFSLMNPIWARTFMDINKNEHGYYFSPNEHIMTYEEVLEHPATNYYFSKIACNDPELMKESIDLITNSIYVGMPMYNISDKNDILYLDPRILLRLERSNGMAAGNTLDEALVQATSELLERYTYNFLLYRDMKEKHYALNLDNIDNPDLQEKIANIKKAGYDFYLIDLSYNYGTPVMMSLLIDRKNGTTRLNFGSFPVFDIAAERVITELYQGVTSFKNNSFGTELQIPYKVTSDLEMREEYSNTVTGRILSADFIDNLEMIDSYNKEVFVDKHYNNKELRQYYCDLCAKLNMKIYYLDNSLSEKIYAVHLIIEPANDKFIPYSPIDGEKPENDIVLVQRGIYYLNILKDFYTAIYNGTRVNLAKFIDFLVAFGENNTLWPLIGNIFLWGGIFSENRPDSGVFNVLQFLITMSDLPLDELEISLLDSEFYLSFRKYQQLMAYVKTNSYSNNELLHIFNDIFNFNITEEDIIKCFSPAYLL